MKNTIPILASAVLVAALLWMPRRPHPEDFSREMASTDSPSLETVPRLIDRLGTEEDPAAAHAILRTMGERGDSSLLPVLLKEISPSNPRRSAESIAAMAAIARRTGDASMHDAANRVCRRMLRAPIDDARPLFHAWAAVRDLPVRIGVEEIVDQGLAGEEIRVQALSWLARRSP